LAVLMVKEHMSSALLLFVGSSKVQKREKRNECIKYCFIRVYTGKWKRKIFIYKYIKYFIKSFTYLKQGKVVVLMVCLPFFVILNI